MTILPEWRLKFQGYQSAPRDILVDVRLNANEGPLPGPFRAYPLKRDPQVINKFAKLYDVEENQIIMDRGIDGVLEVVLQTLANEGSTVLTAGPTYGMYKILTDLNGAKYLELPWDDQGMLSEAFFDEVNKAPEVIIVCRPNNPCGRMAAKDQMIELLNLNRGRSLVIIDEAYGEFVSSNATCLDLIDEYSNLMVCRTLSKAYSLAGLRVGFGIAQKELIKELIPFQAPYPISVAVLEWLKENFNHDYVKMALKEVGQVKLWKEKLALALGVFGRVELGHANFVTLYTNQAKEMFQFLLERKVLVRYFAYENKPHALRFTIGHEEEMKKLLKDVMEMSQ